MTKRTELLPGVWLNTVQTDRFKTGCFSINLLRPLTMEDASPNALLPSVLLRGCGAYPDMQAISTRLDELYGSSVGTLVRKKGEVQTVGLYADFLEDQYAGGAPLFRQVLDFVRQLMFDPCLEGEGFLGEYVDGERLNLSNAIASRINEKRAYAVSRLLKTMCAGEAYAVPRLGEEQPLQAVSAENLYARHRELLANSRIELFYLGQQPQDAVEAVVRGLLADLPKGSRQPVKTETVWTTHPVQYAEETMDVTQGKLTIGLRTPITAADARFPALMLLNAVYGSGVTSKLFVHIREEQSLCYYAGSSIDKFKGIMLVDSGIEFSNYQVALDGILHQLELCKQGQITEEELESARTHLVSGFRTGMDSPGRLDDYAIGQAIAGLDGSMADMAQAIGQVTLEQVVEAANTLQTDTVFFLKGAQA